MINAQDFSTYRWGDFVKAIVTQHGSDTQQLSNYQILSEELAQKIYKLASETLFIPPFTKEELKQALSPYLFNPKQNVKIEDPCGAWRAFRWSKAALGTVISEVIERLAPQEGTILEIGSGTDYPLHPRLIERTVRTQPSSEECQYFAQEVREPIYRIDMQELSSELERVHKSVSCIFALNVFDTLISEARKADLCALSKLQRPGDVIISIHDLNPALDIFIKEMIQLHPDHFPVLFLPVEKMKQHHTTIILVPKTVVGAEDETVLNIVKKYVAPEHQILATQAMKQYLRNFSSGFSSCRKAFLEAMESEAQLLNQGETREAASLPQAILHVLNGMLGLSVIVLEQFLSERLKEDFLRAGYEPLAPKYDAAFVEEEWTKQQPIFNPPVLYRPVTDMITHRPWSVTDPNFLNSLAEKGLKLPPQFTQEYCESLAPTNRRVFGAEVLVLAARKLAP